MRNFIGRKKDIALFEKIWSEKKSQIVTVLGRRRVGKSALIHKVSRQKNAWIFEAVEGETTQGQIQHFLGQLARFADEPHLADLNYSEWSPVFELLTQKIRGQASLILCFDELTWMAAGRTKLVSLIKFYWDRDWKHHPHLILILCGSVTSWMIKNIVRSRALYGRISRHVTVEPLKPFEVLEYVGRKRGQQELLEYLLCFGGIPKYLEEFDFGNSIQVNIEETCFQGSGFFVEEADKIFYTQFKETRVYQKITDLLLGSPLTLQGLADRLDMPSGGGFKAYLDNLSSTSMVESLPLIKSWRVGKKHCYYFVDEFLRFYSQFIAPFRAEIKKISVPGRFEKFTRQKWAAFLGLAFERFCLKHRYLISLYLGFYNKLLACGPAFDLKKGGYQFDLVFLRTDHVFSLCEIKYSIEPLGTAVIHEFENKLRVAELPKGVTVERILIVNQDPSPALVASSYFHRVVTAEQLIRFEW